MNVSSIAQLATTMSTQRISAEVGASVAKLANNQAEAQGAAAVELINSVPKPQGSLGHNINVMA